MAKKNPILPQINRTSGLRPYVQTEGSYTQKVRRITDRALEYAMREYQQFMKHSEFKKPNQAINYDDMEYGQNDWDDPTPGPHPPPPPGPGPTPGPGPGPGPSPGPSPPGPGPNPPPWWNDVWFCQIPHFEFCPGVPVAVNVVTNDDITQVNLPIPGDDSGSGAGKQIILNPGDGTNFLYVCATTKHGATCCGIGSAKDPAECRTLCGSPSIGYTTTQMNINETQQLTVVGGYPGTTYTWTVSGGGSITSEGLYTAPSSNASCSSNPTINLLCEGIAVDSLNIAINGWTGNETAYWVTIVTGALCSWAYGGYPYKCNGVANGGYSSCNSCICNGCGYPNCCCYPNLGDPCTCQHGPGPIDTCTATTVYASVGGVCADYSMPTPGTYDKRTGAMIAGGCCPAALL